MKLMIASGRPSLLGLNAKSFQKVAVYEKVAFSISKADNVVFPIFIPFTRIHKIVSERF